MLAAAFLVELAEMLAWGLVHSGSGVWTGGTGFGERVTEVGGRGVEGEGPGGRRVTME